MRERLVCDSVEDGAGHVQWFSYLEPWPEQEETAKPLQGPAVEINPHYRAS